MEVETKTTVETHKKLDLVDLVQLLDLTVKATNIQVWVGVPGGGDWSNTDLSLGKDCPLQVSYEEKS